MLFVLVATVTAAAPTLDEFHSWMAVHGVLFGNYGWTCLTGQRTPHSCTRLARYNVSVDESRAMFTALPPLAV